MAFFSWLKENMWFAISMIILVTLIVFDGRDEEKKKRDGLEEIGRAHV